mmetsp:Transcript_16539/g.29799  ORF Transcript_16539/g.29799 Transcript_16539/m.29799 type:complete len:87 (+) Transcript_16539:16-276(+)
MTPVTVERLWLQALRLSIWRFYGLQRSVRDGSFVVGLDKEWPPSRISVVYRKEPLSLRLQLDCEALLNTSRIRQSLAPLDLGKRRT